MELRKATFFEAKCFRNNFRSAANAYVINRFQVQIILQQLVVDKISPHLPNLYPPVNLNLDASSVDKRLRKESVNRNNSLLGQLKWSKFLKVKEVPKRTYFGSYKPARKYASNSIRRPKSITDNVLPLQPIDENNNFSCAKVFSNVAQRSIKPNKGKGNISCPLNPNPFDDFQFSEQPKFYSKHSNKTKAKYFFNKYDIPYLMNSLEINS